VVRLSTGQRTPGNMSPNGVRATRLHLLNDVFACPLLEARMPLGPPESVRFVANVASVAPVMDSADPVGAFDGPLTVGKRNIEDTIANAYSQVYTG
jgi:hypothetical protein